jgi:hypothetical protein
VLRRELVVLMTLKLAALLLLWALFFSPAHRPPASSSMFAPVAGSAPAPPPGGSPAPERAGD